MRSSISSSFTSRSATMLILIRRPACLAPRCRQHLAEIAPPRDGPELLGIERIERHVDAADAAAASSAA